MSPHHPSSFSIFDLLRQFVRKLGGRFMLGLLALSLAIGSAEEDLLLPFSDEESSMKTLRTPVKPLPFAARRVATLGLPNLNNQSTLAFDPHHPGQPRLHAFVSAPRNSVQTTLYSAPLPEKADSLDVLAFSAFATVEDPNPKAAPRRLYGLDGLIYFSTPTALTALSDFNQDTKIDSREAVPCLTIEAAFPNLPHSGEHALTMGPDSRLYGTFGPEGMASPASIKSGGVFRCLPDGSEFEIFAQGLSDPVALAFNTKGDLFVFDTGLASKGQTAVFHLYFGFDGGWRTRLQVREQAAPADYPKALFWNDEQEEQNNPTQIPTLPASPPPVLILPYRLNEVSTTDALDGSESTHFWLAHDAGLSQLSFYQQGLGYYLNRIEDVWTHGPVETLTSDGQTSLYFTSEDELYRANFAEPEFPPPFSVSAYEQSAEDLLNLLSHSSFTVRQQAQAALVEQPDVLTHLRSQLKITNFTIEESDFSLLPPLDNVSITKPTQFASGSAAQRHSIWALEQVARREDHPHRKLARAALIGLLQDERTPPDLRALAIQALANNPNPPLEIIQNQLRSRADPVRAQAAIALARNPTEDAVTDLLQMALYASDMQDSISHSIAVYALSTCATPNDLASLSGHAVPAMRRATLDALVRQEHRHVSHFLFDHEPSTQEHAVRRLADLDIPDTQPALISVLDEYIEKETLGKIPSQVAYSLIHTLDRRGGKDSAKRLGELLKNETLSLPLRRETLRLLAGWDQTRPVDLATGRKLGTSAGIWEDVRPFFKEELAPFLSAGHPLRKEAMNWCSEKKSLPNGLSDNFLHASVSDSTLPAELRIEALEQLSQAEESEFPIHPLLLKILEGSSEGNPPTLKLKALALLSKYDPEHSFTLLSQALNSSNAFIRQGATLQLATNPHPEVPHLIVSYFDRLLAGDQVDRAIELEMTMAAQLNPHEAVKEALHSYEEYHNDDHLAPFLTALSGGDSERGRKIFFEHPVARCTSCHMSDSSSGSTRALAPSLENVAKRGARHILESLVDPSARFRPGYALSTLTLTDGEEITGQVVSENELNVTLHKNGELLEIQKQWITEVSEPSSPMPPTQHSLTQEKIRDLLAYLLTLEETSEDQFSLAP